MYNKYAHGELVDKNNSELKRGAITIRVLCKLFAVVALWIIMMFIILPSAFFRDVAVISRREHHTIETNINRMQIQRQQNSIGTPSTTHFLVIFSDETRSNIIYRQEISSVVSRRLDNAIRERQGQHGMRNRNLTIYFHYMPHTQILLDFNIF